MDPTTDPDHYSTEALLRWAPVQNATLRELLTAVAADLERLACPHPAWVFLPRAMRLRRRLWEAGG
jgi:hypothetical protein